MGAAQLEQYVPIASHIPYPLLKLPVCSPKALERMTCEMDICEPAWEPNSVCYFNGIPVLKVQVFLFIFLYFLKIYLFILITK